MQSLPRRLVSAIKEDLDHRKMVFLSGPRQCGKTTLVKSLLRPGDSYLNWDVPEDRTRISKHDLSEGASVWAFDELHKFRRWKNWLKGLYDKYGAEKMILVTGSARLEAFSRGGDSLQGRYFPHRLHPLTVGELLASKLPNEKLFENIFRQKRSDATAEDAVLDLLRYGGFPEPFVRQEDRFSARWRAAYGARLVREDLRDLFRFDDLDRIELLYERLTETVGGSLNYANLARHLEVSLETIQRWILALENIYGVFRVPPMGFPKIRAVRKEQKLYFWDWSRVADPGGRLENMVAVHLMTFVHYGQDEYGENLDLRYFRDVHGREVDFVILRDRKPWCYIEVKSSEQAVEPALIYVLERYPAPNAFQVTLKSDEELVAKVVGKTKIRRCPLAQFLAGLP